MCVVWACAYESGRSNFDDVNLAKGCRLLLKDVTTEYYIAAEEICKSYPAEYLQPCIAVVMQQ